MTLHKNVKFQKWVWGPNIVFENFLKKIIVFKANYSFFFKIFYGRI